MKLNTLLLTSAATLMATSVAFAADLPSKKAAPAAGSVQVCKVGGMTGFTIPGSDTCLGISGVLRYNASYQDASPLEEFSGAGILAGTADLPADNDGRRDWHQAGFYRFNVDARTNTEVGVVRSFIRMTNGDFDKAYIQFAGITAGVKDSIADIVSTDSNNSGTGFDAPTTGIDYQISTGGITFGIGAEQSIDRNINNSATAVTGEVANLALLSDRPDLVAHISGTSGNVGFAVAAVSHQAVDALTLADNNGWAVIGRLNAKLGDIGVRVWGAMSEGASAYTGNYTTTTSSPAFTNVTLTNTFSGMPDFDDAQNFTNEGSAFGGELSVGLGKATTLYVLGRQNKHELGAWDWTETQLGVQLSHTIAKGLSIHPEFIYTDGEINNFTQDAASDATYEGYVYALRIQRDF